MRTIQWALTQAEADATIERVYVARGTYETRFEDGTQIVLGDGVSLLGGYAPDWGTRDPETYTTTIVDVSTQSPGISENSPHHALFAPPSVSLATTLSGFEFVVTGGNYRAAVLLDGSPTVTSNRFVPPDSSLGLEEMTAIFVRNGAPRLEGNTITFTQTNQASEAFGIRGIDSDLWAANNRITLANADEFDSLRGFYFQGGSPTVIGNSVRSELYGQLLVLLDEAQPTVVNNVFEVSQAEASTAEATCVLQVNALSAPVRFDNNALRCGRLWRRVVPSAEATNLADLETALPDAEDNVALQSDLLAESADLFLDASAPCEVTQGGFDTTLDVEFDTLGNARTVPVTIGAHEWDGGCI